ncbi:hypothetical protein GUJ93_ZPchr0001g31996 [Zizania palustris]|uniref:Uncharacterized protein n=1 Tax=Zizania palustris TaxID=103762 RepID=A0A8J5SFH4_ZIZPA|nr:hypothetical protein GUJ93_ZPchr0001g31996 [Zizania palustris]
MFGSCDSASNDGEGLKTEQIEKMESGEDEDHCRAENGGRRGEMWSPATGQWLEPGAEAGFGAGEGGSLAALWIWRKREKRGSRCYL